jgi:hypothetical protein
MMSNSLSQIRCKSKKARLGILLIVRYVDFTHDAYFSLLLPTLNLTSFAAAGPPPLDKIPKHRTFVSSEIMPFATNLQVQVLTCGARHIGESDDAEDSKGVNGETEDLRTREDSARMGRKVRLVLNDGVVPLTGIRGCGEHREGLCDLGVFVESTTELMADGDFEGVCT